MNNENNLEKLYFNFEIIKNFEDLVDLVKVVKKDPRFKDIYLSLKDVNQYNYKNTDLEKQVKFSKALIKILNFTDNYNKVINAINLYNNIEVCNGLLLRNVEEYNKEQNKYEESISPKELTVEEADLEIERLYSLLKNSKKKDHPKIKLELKNKENIYRKLILENNYKPMNFWKRLFTRNVINEKTLSENKNLILENKVKLKNENKIEFLRKTNSVIALNNYNLEKSKKYINENIISDLKVSLKTIGVSANNERIITNKNIILTSVLNTVFELENKIKFEEIPQKLHYKELVTSLIAQKNKENYYGFLIDNIGNLVFKENSHFEKFSLQTKSKTRRLINDIKEHPIKYSTGAILSFSGLLVDKYGLNFEIKDVIAGFYVASKIFNKEPVKINDSPKEIANQFICSGIKAVDEMFEDNKYQILSNFEYDDVVEFYESKGKSLVNINLVKNKDVEIE